MSKYIDAEWLGSRVHDVPLANGAIHGCVDKLDLIEAPSVDICFCKECRYGNDYYYSNTEIIGRFEWCYEFNDVTGYCPFGRRRPEKKEAEDDL